jgi:large subunit ribosomal protein L17
MRHNVAGKKLSRSSGHRTALRRTLMNQFFQNEKIETTLAKAQAIRSEVERIITIAKHGNKQEVPADKVHKLRQIIARLGGNADTAKKVMDDLAERYENRPGGYTRIYKLGLRAGDAAEIVRMELVEE